MRLFRAVTTLFATMLVVSAVLHLALLVSDSPEYRHWVKVQLALHLLGTWLLWHVRKFRFDALLGLAVASVPAIYSMLAISIMAMAQFFGWRPCFSGTFMVLSRFMHEASLGPGPGRKTPNPAFKRD